MPVNSRKISAARKIYSRGAARPVPMAVPTVNAPAVAPQRLGIRAHLAPERRQSRVLKFGPTDFDNVSEAFFRVLKRFLKLENALFENPQHADGREPERRGKRVVC
jgi:hypothetical protein